MCVCIRTARALTLGSKLHKDVVLGQTPSLYCVRGFQPFLGHWLTCCSSSDPVIFISP